MKIKKFLSNIFGRSSELTPLAKLAEIIGLGTDKEFNDPASYEMAVTTLLKCQKAFLDPTPDNKVELACFVRAYSQANAVRFDDAAGKLCDLIAQYGGLAQEESDNQKDKFIEMAKEGAIGSKRYSDLSFTSNAFTELTQ